MQFIAEFEHTAGGDSLLPEADRGFFDNYVLVVEAADETEAEVKAMATMYNMVKAEHPHWIDRAVDDLCLANVYEV